MGFVHVVQIPLSVSTENPPVVIAGAQFRASQFLVALVARAAHCTPAASDRLRDRLRSDRPAPQRATGCAPQRPTGSAASDWHRSERPAPQRATSFAATDRLRSERPAPQRATGTAASDRLRSERPDPLRATGSAASDRLRSDRLRSDRPAPQRAKQIQPAPQTGEGRGRGGEGGLIYGFRWSRRT